MARRGFTGWLVRAARFGRLGVLRANLSDGSHGAFVMQEDSQCMRTFARHNGRSTVKEHPRPRRPIESFFFVELCTWGILKEATFGLETPKPAVCQHTLTPDSHIRVSRLPRPQHSI